MKFVTKTQVMNALWIASFIMSVFGGFVGNLKLYDGGIAAMGIVGLVFYRQMSGEFMRLYPTTSKLFTEILVVAVSAMFLLIGLGALLGFWQLGAR